MPIAFRQRTIIVVLVLVLGIIIAFVFIVWIILVITRPRINVLFMADNQIESIVGVDGKHEFLAPFHFEGVFLVLTAINDFGFAHFFYRGIDFILRGFSATLLPPEFEVKDFAWSVLSTEISRLRHESVAVPTDNGEVVPCVICGVAVDVMLLNGLPRLVTDTAGVPVRHHEAVFDLDRNGTSPFQKTSITFAELPPVSRQMV